MAQRLSDLPVGAKVKDPGSIYNGKPIIFQVVAKNHPGYPTNSVTLLTEKIISVKAFDAKEPSNTDTNRRNYGNNRYLHANIRKWMNTAGLPWYAPQHGADTTPNTAGVSSNPYDNENGFLSNLSAAFQSRILPTTLTVARNTITDGGGSETVTDKIFFPSTTEVGLANENGIAEGSKYAFFTNDASRQALPTTEAVAKSDYTNASFKDTLPWHYWLRTPLSGYSYGVRSVDASGVIGYSIAHFGSIGIRPALNFLADTLVSSTPESDGAYSITFNANPTITLGETDGRTLYEGDTINLAGNAYDTDVNDVVSVKFSINNGAERTLAAGVSNGTAPIVYDKTLTFTNSKILDGASAITSDLAEGVAHTLRVWSEDDKGGKSIVQTRLFYIVANRPPTIQVDAFTTQTGLIESELIEVSGSVNDLDGNDVTLRYKLNDGGFVQVYSGAPGPFSFTIPVAVLKDGVNTLTLQVVDTFNFTNQKTYAIGREFNGSALTEAVARYDLNPATGEARGLVSWIERDTAGSVDASISMVDAAAPEDFEAMEKTNTVELIDGITEDEFEYIAADPKAKITLKLTSSGDVAKISGAFQA